MLTIKINAAGSILISQSPEVAVGLKDSELYVAAMAMAAGSSVPLDAIQSFPAVYDEYETPVSDELIINLPRPNAKGQPVAVLITDIPSSEIPELTGTNYQFVYAGDEAEVLTENGIKIHHIK
ncbi:hypothetical protein [Pantoea ananatis]|uniref:hypothetical protein n=1 Tax=Pantoea ananas TaxID=553 RepID=UPI003C253B1B